MLMVSPATGGGYAFSVSPEVSKPAQCKNHGASPQTQVPVEDDAVHVIKVEYLENGPLFSELKFYQRAAKQEHRSRILRENKSSDIIKWQVYLADYGLSYRYCPNGNHKQYQENPRKGHNGTIEFTSIDAHKGVAYAEKPKYQVLKKILLDGLESSGMRYDGPLEFSTAAAASPRNHRAAKASRARLPKPPPKPAQQKGKKPEGEEPACQNKACVGVTGTQLLGEERPNTRSRKPPPAELQQHTELLSVPQRAPLPRPSPKAVQQKEDTRHGDHSSCLSRPHTRGTRRQLQVEEKPLRFYTTHQEPEHPKKEDTARELPPFDPYRILSESRKKHNHLRQAWWKGCPQRGSSHTWSGALPSSRQKEKPKPNIKKNQNFHALEYLLNSATSGVAALSKHNPYFVMSKPLTISKLKYTHSELCM
ncbi:hypothetical protein IHE44_0008768 [Lamprotornis superbus]|uniref:Uncharacterized protein n=1 Tax=Lamprotornis superbus TaxID=245042 RepID=A0A835TYS8_9PASS|nr:hypothetical protein IHE44_0008768 [Lamprotornis superbus]